MTSREEFEAWVTDESKWPAAAQRTGDTYRLMTTQQQWIAWQAARAAAPSRTHPDHENTLALLREWQQHHDDVATLMDGIKASIGLDIDGPMFDIVWKLFDAYTGALSAEVGDFGCWLSWYGSENQMGALRMDAGYDGKTKPIKTLDDLCWLIMESRARETP